MGNPTEKQINFAAKLGIENAQNFTSEALSKMIDEKVGNKPKPAYQPQQNNAAISPAVAQVILTRTDKPHSFEFGKASRRHKIYYGEVADLKIQYAELKEAGFIDLEDEIEFIKPQSIQ